MNTPSERFKAVRKELGLTQNEFARELNISQVAVYKLEEGQIKSISQEVTQILEEKFGINKIWLHFGEGMMYLDDTTNMYSVYNKLEYLAKLVENVLNRLGGTAPVLSEKRGRGRPRKSSVSTTDSSAVSGRRGPGRPRKNPVAEETTGDKRGPGRPRKNPVSTETSSDKRGPGRPRKTALTEVTEKRTPGRPRKNPVADTSTAKRTPGRPRKNPIAETTTAKRTPGRPRKSPVAETSTVKRTPGRPRKNPVAAVTKTAKRSAGRPRKNPIVETTAKAKRGPGRPAKQVVETKVDKVAVKPVAKPAAIVKPAAKATIKPATKAATKPAENAAAKRGPGRPAKAVTATNTTTAKASGKKRGRPSKSK